MKKLDFNQMATIEGGRSPQYNCKGMTDAAGVISSVGFACAFIPGFGPLASLAMFGPVSGALWYASRTYC